MIISRRRALWFIAAPAIVKATSLMPIHGEKLINQLDIVSQWQEWKFFGTRSGVYNFVLIRENGKWETGDIHYDAITKQSKILNRVASPA